MRKLFVMLCASMLVAAPVWAKGKSSSIEDAIADEIRDEIYGDDGKQKGGKGRPDNPGEHGRDNAAQKQAHNPGKGSKNHDSGGSLLEDIFDDDDDRDKDDYKGQKKGKGKNK